MNSGVICGIARCTGATFRNHPSIRTSALPFAVREFKSVSFFNRHCVSSRCYSSVPRKELDTFVRLDSEGSGKFVYDNFGRLRVFLKFLALQSVPIAILAYCYRHFEQERQSLYSASLGSVDEALQHLWAITRSGSCFLILDGKAHMVNYSVGNKVELGDVDSVEAFLNKLQPQKRDLLRSVYVSLPSDICDEHSLKCAKEVHLLLYNQALDSFAYVKSEAAAIEDPDLKKSLWTPRLGDESNKLALLATKTVIIGFGGSSRTVELDAKEDWSISQ